MELRQLKYRVDSVEKQDAYKTQYILIIKKALGGDGTAVLDTMQLDVPKPEPSDD